MNVNNRWFQLVASLIAMIMIANLQYAWTLFVEPLRASTGWRLSDIQFAFTLFILFQTGAAARRLADRRLGPAASSPPPACCAVWAGPPWATPRRCRCSTRFTARPASARRLSIADRLIRAQWFKDRRGLAAGIMAAGFGGGTALFIPFISSMIQSSGYQQAFLARGCFSVGDRCRRAVLATSGRGTGSRRQARSRWRRPGRPPPVHDDRDAAHAAVLRDVRDVRPDGHGRTAGDGQRRADGAIVGMSAAALTLAATLSPLANGASRIFWGGPPIDWDARRR